MSRYLLKFDSFMILCCNAVTMWNKIWGMTVDED